MLRKQVEEDPAFPAVVLFAPAPVGAAEPFFQTRWPSARVICDPEYRLYQDLGSPRMTVLGLFNPVLWWKGLKALTKGYRNGKPQGDVWLLGGGLLVASDSRVLWLHRPKNASDIVRPHMVPAVSAVRAGQASEPSPVT